MCTRCTWMKCGVGMRTCTPLALSTSTLCGVYVCPTSKCACSTGIVAHTCVRWYSVLAPSASFFVHFVLVRFAVCERCTEIDDHLQNATSDREKKLWLEAKKIHRTYVSGSYCSLHVTHTNTVTSTIFEPVFVWFLRCERRGECITSVVHMLLLPAMP